MKRKLKAIILLICVMVASVILASCSQPNKFDEYAKQGYTVKVTFDGNGAALLTKVGNKLVDLYNPSNYTPDENGVVHIKVIDPEKRGLTDDKTGFLAMPNFMHFGWYRTREAVLNDDGKFVDDLGNVLEYNESNGKYYIEGTNDESFPLYNYSDPFNFDTDTIDAKVGEPIEVTLYVAWVKQFEFNFYHVKDGKATFVRSDMFDYRYIDTTGKNVIGIPSYTDGVAMDYSYEYSNGGTFNFPKIDNETFDKAYLDEELTKEITTPTFEHQGAIDLETCKATNRIQNIYFTTIPGNVYKIHTAQDLIDNADPYGVYEIDGDLDFTGLTWPTAFSQTVFNGKMVPKSGQQIKFSNIEARFASTSSTTAGVFGALSESAVIENIAFENVKLTVSSVPTNVKDLTMGILFGNVDDKAKLTNVSLTNATMIIGYVSINTVDDVSNNKVNLLGNGNIQGITVTDTLHLQLSGKKVGSTFRFLVDPTKATVDENNNVSLISDSFKNEDGKQIYEIQ